MNGNVRRAEMIFLVMLCMGVCFGCASGQGAEESMNREEILQSILPDEEQEGDSECSDGEQEGDSECLNRKQEEDSEYSDEEQDHDTWANWRESRICYADGYDYYVSQMDHYYLYRCREDGSEPQCLAKVHAGSICVQDDEVFFINQTDGYGIYRMKTDGTGLTKLCDKGSRLQIDAEYVYFCDSYHAKYDTAGLVTEETSEFDEDFLYRMNKDGSERQLIAAGVRQYVLGDGSYTGVVYWRWKGNDIVVSRMDSDGSSEEELCRIESGRNILVYGGEIFFVEDEDGAESKIVRVSLQNGETRSFLAPQFTECAIYEGRFYVLNERADGDLRSVTISQIDLEDGSQEEVYRYEYTCEGLDIWKTSDLFATGNGIFFRRYVSEEEGCQWFRLTDDKRVVRWEDAAKIPGTLPADCIEYGELSSVKSVMESTEGYEAYLSDGLEYEAYHSVDENGEGDNPYRIWLPQFNSRIPGYKKINEYFQSAYQDALDDKENFFTMLDEETDAFMYSQMTGYDYVYIGEKYITVAEYTGGYTGGIRAWTTQHPVTFDRETGEVISLEDLLGMTTQEASSRLTASAYKYMEGIGNGWFFLTEENKMAEEFDPEKFFLFPEGVGIYYERYDIDCGAAGDYLFVIPWEELNR